MGLNSSRADTAAQCRPYFGACIHVPPPPNQLVHTKPETPQPMGDIWDAYAVSGTLRIGRAANEVGVAAYTMDLEPLEVIE